MITLRHILLVIHIISAGIWITQFVIEMAFVPILRAQRGKPLELTLTLAQWHVLSVMGRVGGMGVLLTGLGLIAVDGFGLLGIGTGFTPTWLLIKQLVYIVAMILVGTLVVPYTARVEHELAEAAEGTSIVTPEVRQLSERIRNASLAVNLLVLINIILAVWKPA
ncbi:MAG: DUF2269 family protein [Anaerolineae bacterium]|nr:DUF2269 family protein [Anaerolineae bacterium]